MGRFHNGELLAIFEHDSVSNSLQEPDTMHSGSAAAVAPNTTVAALTGMRPIIITEISCVFGDITITDPSADRYLGWSLQSAIDGGTGPTYAEVQGYTANDDLPLIHEDGVDVGTVLSIAINIPFNLLAYVGAGGIRADTAPRGGNDAGQAPQIRVAPNATWQVRVGAYLAGSLAAITGLDDVVIFVYGYRA